MEWSGSLFRSPGKGASPHAAGTGSSARRSRRFAGMDSSGRPPGSELAQRLFGLSMPLIECTTARAKCCGSLRAHRSTPNGCSTNAKTTGYVHLR
ncbi:Type I inositol-1,4,5-trisphosphate 5-phosphatase CVP2 [Hordeum vulgare]|nr:Type I inositol-1,4,5-trisphosphate 5-phosphatase CVP2 [Hordeum vulgare]